MFEFVKENVEPLIIEDFTRVWTAKKGFKGITERMAKALKNGKNFLVLYESIPLILSQKILTSLIEHLQNDATGIIIRLDEINNITRFYDIMEEYFNSRGSHRFILFCSRRTFDLIENDSLGAILIPFFDIIEKTSGLVNVTDYLDYMKLTEKFPYGLNAKNLKFVRDNFDLPKLVFFTCFASLAENFQMDLDDIVSLMKSLTFQKIGNTVLLIPSAKYLEKRKTYNVFSRILDKTTLPLDFIAYQSFLDTETYKNILISLYLLKKLTREEIKSNLSALSVYYSSEYYENIKKILFDGFSPKVTWFLFRLLLEAYMSQGISPEIKDYQIRYHLWSVYPAKNTVQEKGFQDQVLKMAKKIVVEVSRSQFDQLSYQVLEAKTLYLLDPILTAPHLLDKKNLGEVEIKSLLGSIFEIIESTSRRWLEDEKASEQNGKNLLKIQDLINIVCILHFVYDSTTLKQQIPEFMANLNSLVAKAEGDHTNLKSLNLLTEKIQLSKIFHHNEGLLKNLKALREAAEIHEKIKNIGVQKIDEFLGIWSDFVNRDILNERKGLAINRKLWNVLSRKYHDLNTFFIDKYSDYISKNEKKQCQVLNYVSDLQKERKVVFLLIVDSFSFLDWRFLKKKLDNTKFVVMEEIPLLGTFPTETAVGHAAIFSGMDPLENGVFSRVLHMVDGERWKIMEESSEGDIVEKISRGSYFKNKITHILRSMNTNRKGLIISPFKKTKLTTVLKCLITEENAKWIENEFDWERTQFEQVVNWVRETVCSRKKDELLDYGTIILLFPNLDERGHGGKRDWDLTVYFAKLEDELIHILNGIARTVQEHKLQASIVITSDHGKFFRWEAKRIQEFLGDDFCDFNKTRNEITKTCIKHVSKGRLPVTSAKYVLIWVDANEKDELVGEIELILNEKQGVQLIDDFKKMSNYSENIKVMPPNMAVASMYSYVGPGLFQHSGLSLEELIIPYIRLDVNLNV